MIKAKNSTKERNYNILRWAVLVPTVCIGWYLVASVCLSIEGLFYTPELWQSWGHIFMILDFGAMPCIVMFFVARAIAPKYKNLMGCMAIILCIVLAALLFYGLAHSY